MPLLIFFFNDTAPTEIYTRPYTLSLHDALPISGQRSQPCREFVRRIRPDQERRKRRSEEHTSELQSHGLISYAVFCLKKKQPRYLMGLGSPLDLLEAVERVVDLFVSVLPARVARNVQFWVPVFLNNTPTTEIYTSPYTLSLHDALPISVDRLHQQALPDPQPHRGRAGRNQRRARQ